MTESAAIVSGPTYEEMRDPSELPVELRKRARAVLNNDEFDPLNLFNITWRRPDNTVNHLVLPRELTGVEANIIVLLGKDFPSGSHKVGPAYTTLIEVEFLKGMRPGDKTVVGPSTGNFGIGAAYISKLKGYRSIVVMPDSMSDERYERIRKYGGGLVLTPGSESDVMLTLERTHRDYVGNPQYEVLAQFELLPNYRFHYSTTGDACLDAGRGYGDGRVRAFVAAPGSAGTLAAGDAIRKVYPDCTIVALEPRECPTLTDMGQGQHRIEGIGDKMVTLIHNVLNTDYVMLVHDDDSVMGLKAIQDGTEVLSDRLGIPFESLEGMRDCFGVSGICNIIGAIKTAKLLGLGPADNIVTVATDGVDRYYSVLKDLVQRRGEPDADTLELWARGIFLGATTREILDVRSPTQKERLFRQKEQVWTQFDYNKEYLDWMRRPEFWDEQIAIIPQVDAKIKEMRGPLPLGDER